MQNISFRLAEDGDLDAILSIWEENMAHEMPDVQTFQKCIDTLTELFNTRQGFYNYWVSVDEATQKVIGWQSYFPIFTTPLKKGTAVESSTYVAKSYQSKGVAYCLMSYALNNLEKSDLQYVYGYIKQTSIGVQNMVQKLGFKIVGIIPETALFPHEESKFLYLKKLSNNTLN